MKIINVVSENAIDDEAVTLCVTADGTTNGYILMDSTYDEKSRLSNKVRHTYIFPDVSVKAGEWVCVFTREGDHKKVPGNPVQHFLYWGLEAEVWNNAGDRAWLVQAIDVGDFRVRGK